MPPRPGIESWQRFDERGTPAIIAHAAGNNPGAARSAIDCGADFVEVDIWFRGQTFEARHERRVGPLPVLFEKWYVSRAPSRPFTLYDLVDATEGEVDIFLDFKTSQPEAAHQVAALLRELPAPARISASSQWWWVLRELYDELPQAAVFYSIDAQAKLDLFRSVIDRDPRPAGISCRGSLLTEGVVREMHDRGIRVAAWTVDDLSEAAQLASWGVDAITTHNVEAMHTLLTSAT